MSQGISSAPPSSPPRWWTLPPSASSRPLRWRPEGRRRRRSVWRCTRKLQWRWNARVSCRSRRAKRRVPKSASLRSSCSSAHTQTARRRHGQWHVPGWLSGYGASHGVFPSFVGRPDSPGIMVVLVLLGDDFRNMVYEVSVEFHTFSTSSRTHIWQSLVQCLPRPSCVRPCELAAQAPAVLEVVSDSHIDAQCKLCRSLEFQLRSLGS